jgi:hypothetical protein
VKYFFVLDQDCIFKPVKWFLSQNSQRGSLLVWDWLHSIWQNHLYVMLLHIQGCFLYSESSIQICASRRLYVDFKIEKLDPKHPPGGPSITSGCSSVRNIRPDGVAIPSERPSVSISFEMFKVASGLTSQHHVRTLFSVWQVKEVPSQTFIWEDSCNRLDDRSTPSGRYPW